MKPYSKKRLLLLLLPVLTLNVSCSSQQSSTNPKGLSGAPIYESSIQDGAVYFINSVANPNIRFNVSGASYSNGSKIIAYTQLGWGNERFILKKQYSCEYGQTYRLIPLDAQNKVLKIQDDSPDYGKNLQVADEEYSDQKLVSDKFIFTYVPSNGSFRISTGASNFGECLSLKNGSTTSGTEIVQRSFFDSASFEWFLIKSDNLGINTKTTVNINGSNNNVFNLSVPRKGTYIIETTKYADTDVDTFLTLSNSNSEVLAQNDNGGSVYGFSKIEYYFSQPGKYQVYLRGANGGQFGNVNLVVRPQKEVYFNTLWDADNDLDNVTPLLNRADQWANMGYYSNVISNTGKYSIFETAQSGNTHINNDYYVFWGHGSAGFVRYYNGLDDGSNGNNDLNALELPSDLTNLHSLVWIACQGAALASFGNYSTSMARESVVRGASNSIGWRGSVSNGGVWLLKYMDELANGYSGKEAARQATNQTRSALWWDFITNSSNDLWNPVIYYKKVSNDIVYSVANDAGYNIENADDGGYLQANPSGERRIKKSATTTTDEPDVEIDYYGKKYTILRFGNVITNVLAKDYNRINKEITIKGILNKYKDVISSHEAKTYHYIFEFKNTFSLYSVSYKEDVMKIIDEKDGSSVPLEQFMRIADSNFNAF
jgi:hypothetical protein